MSAEDGLPSEAAAQLRREVARLEKELQASQDRLETWKEKAKVGVDELRQRVMTLTAALRESELRCAALAQQQRPQPSSSSPSLGAEDVVQGTAIAQLTHFFTNASLLALATTLTMSDEMAGELARRLVAELRSVQDEFDTHRRRTDVTLRLHAKNYESLQKELDERNKALAASKEEVKTRDRALMGRDEAIAGLERQLELVEDARRRLEEERAQALRVPDMQEENYMDELVERRVEEARSEFALMEGAMHAQHKQELLRLVAEHNEELAALQRETEERVAHAVEEAKAVAMQAAVAKGGGAVRRADASSGASASNSRDGDDDAYATLLRDYETVREQLHAARDECATLRRQQSRSLRESTAAVRGTTSVNSASGSGNDTATASSGASAATPSNVAAATEPRQFATQSPRTLSEAVSTISELEANLQFVSNELCRATRELVSLRHGKSPGKPDAAPQATGAMEAQQVAYLRAIIVNVLCAHKDDHVLVRLLPVITTLLHFEPGELDQIYKANPQWVPHR